VKKDKARELVPQTADYVASAAKAALGAVPFIGSLLVEIAGVLIPHQRIDRIVRFAEQLEVRLSGIEQGFVRSQLANENFTDLVEEGLRQAARAVSEERRAYIASLVAESVRTEDISYIESKHMLRILGELNDIEVIRLGSYVSQSRDEYGKKHEAVLKRVVAVLNSPQEVIDKETLQQSYDEHLIQLGLVARYEVTPPINKNDPEALFAALSRPKGPSMIRITSLGMLLCRQIGLSEEERGKQWRLQPSSH
jgi:hypothetical protein